MADQSVTFFFDVPRVAVPPTHTVSDSAAPAEVAAGVCFGRVVLASATSLVTGAATARSLAIA